MTDHYNGTWQGDGERETSIMVPGREMESERPL